MMQNVKIDSNQFLILVIFFTIGTGILEVPSVLAAETKQDAWITAIIGMGIGFLVIWFFTTLALWFPQLSYVQINELVYGKWIGKAVSVLFVMMSFIYSATLLFQSGNFLNTHIMPNTPMSALNILMAGIMVMGVYLGLETIARSAEIFGAIFFITFIVFVVLIAPDIQIDNIKPVFEAESKTMIKSSFFIVLLSSGNAIVLLMIFPAFVNDVKQAKKSFLLGNLIGGLIIIVITFFCISILGAVKTANEIYPTYELAKRISVGNFIERIEEVMALLWILSLYFKMILYFYASVLAIAQILNLKDYRPIIIPLGLIAAFLSLMIYPNIIYKQEWDNTTEKSLSLVVGIILPLLLAVVYGIRRKSLKKEPGK
ncbi:GerAB/ArcD/ProY family transporter [Sporosarcina sp. FA9]|uniref:GerAB/ArcD/ProY family transporter n=1 Tax=Sporosarcina sp. FA9 TaxID=3413030 RepID=UPI003F66078C